MATNVENIVKAAKSSHARHKASVDAAKATAAAVQASTGFGRGAELAGLAGAADMTDGAQ